MSKINMTLCLSHGWDPVLPPSSGFPTALRCLRPEHFLYHMWDSQTFTKQDAFLRQKSINVNITDSLYYKLTTYIISLQKQWDYSVLICNHILPWTWGVQLELKLWNKVKETGQGGGHGSKSLSNPLSIWHRTMAVALALNLSRLGWRVFWRVALLPQTVSSFLIDNKCYIH